MAIGTGNGGLMQSGVSCMVLCGQTVALFLLSATVVGAQEGPAWDDPPGESAAEVYDARRPGSRAQRRSPEWIYPERIVDAEGDLTLAPVNTGLLFVEGHFLPPPYVIRTEGEQILVNDQPVLARTLTRDFDHPRRRFSSPQRILAEQLSAALASGSVVLSFPDQPLAILSRSAGGYQLAACLTREPVSDRAAAASELPEQFDMDVFDRWLDTYEPTAELHSVAGPLIKEVRDAEADSRRAIAAVRRNDTLLYLITVFGMVISVAATGHLLSAKPPSAKDFSQRDPEMVKMVSRSLGLVVILSSLDLFWTIMASKTGKMIELNPIGSQLLHDPMQLIAAKAAVICLSVGLLYFLRHHRQAQTAAWWACLICTLLTFRWLTFNSMFV